MARPLRIEFPAALYHVATRGNDRVAWMATFGEVCRRYDWLCNTYFQMTSHCHVVVEPPEGNLARGMHQLSDVYTRYFNRTYRRVCHRLSAEDDAYAKGMQEGRNWANDHAKYVELKSLNEHLEHNDGHLLLSMEGTHFSPSEYFYEVICGEEGVDSLPDARDFWEVHCHWEGSCDTIAYIDGFAAGTTAVYKEVIDEI